ncbi:MAG: right-handed parallel beta-helix repeat-containing protein [Thermoplasmata archaeon]|nr:MAG: right-handed parallel beta-helix repeat-containing protein [Thermoplasmata archaeon]
MGFLGSVMFESDVVSAPGITIYVDDDYVLQDPTHYKTIQAGVDAANPGDTVFVYNGIYYENVVVGKTINLIGEDRENTIIDSGGSGDVVFITANWVNITGFTATGGGSDYKAGVGLDHAQNCSVSDNSLSFNGWYGMRLQSSNGTTISGNKVISNELSMYIRESSNNVITDNYAYLANWSGIYIVFSSNNNLVANNTCNSTNHGIHCGTINNDIYGNTITGTDQGIEVFEFDNNIRDNNVSYNNLGIYFTTSSHNNFVTNNNISNNNYGVCLSSASNNIIADNEIMYNSMDGIYSTDSSFENIIINNSIISNTLYGIKLEGAGNTRIYHNRFINNNGVGVQASDNSKNFWNDSYPSGGNFWSEWTVPDNLGGPNQDIPGSDGFVDMPYNLDGGTGARDYYPLAIPQETLPPTDLITRYDGINDSVELEWTPSPSLPLDHYLIYRADSATGFDFSTPYNSSLTWPYPINTTWVDPDPGVTAVDDDFYYIVRAANFDESEISITSNTAGVWTRTFQAGTSTFSLPLEPFVKEDTEYYCQAMNASYIKWMNATTCTWTRHDSGDTGNNTFLKVGEGYEIAFAGQNRYTFCGMPGAMIIYDNNALFSGFNPDSEAKNLSVAVEPNGNVTLVWQEPAGMGPGDWYEVYHSDTRDGFFKTGGIDYDLACPPIGLGTNNTTISGLGASDPGSRLYFMVVPFDSLGVRGASTYSIGVWTEEYLAEYDTMGIPLKISVDNTIDWYCDNIPNTVGINYYQSSERRWAWHSTRMPQGAYDPVLVMAEGYQISTSGATKFTFIGR